jgi:1,2-diacylglycerol 3-alpha-glucosyltransferase
MAKIAICAFTFHPQRNGVANVVFEHANYLAAIGHEVTVFTGALQDRGAPAIECSFKVRRYRVQGSFLATNFYRGEISRYLKDLEAERVDVCIFHCWQIWSTDLPLILSRRSLPRCVLVSHGAPLQKADTIRERVRRSLLEPYRKVVMPIIAGRLDDVVFLSHRRDGDRFYDRGVVSALRRPPRVHVVPNGVRLALPARPTDCDALPEGVGLFCYVANLDPVKNHELFLRLFARVRQPQDFCVIVGGGAQKRVAELFALARALGVENYVTIVSRATDSEIAWVLRRSIVQIFTSRSECFPLAVLEASAYGCPTVAFDVGALADIPGVSVARSEEDVRAAIALIRSGCGHNNEAREKLAEEMKRYRWEAVMERFCKCLDL